MMKTQLLKLDFVSIITSEALAKNYFEKELRFLTT